MQETDFSQAASRKGESQPACSWVVKRLRNARVISESMSANRTAAAGNKPAGQLPQPGRVVADGEPLQSLALAAVNADRRSPLAQSTSAVTRSAAALWSILIVVGVRCEFECYDVGHLYTLAHFLDRGLVKPPLLIHCVLGLLAASNAEQVRKAVAIAAELGRPVAWSDEVRQLLALKGKIKID